MTTKEARELLELLDVRGSDWRIDIDGCIAEAKQRGLIERTALEKWNDERMRPVIPDHVLNCKRLVEAGDAMRDELLAENAELKCKKVYNIGCKTKVLREGKTIIDCGKTYGNTMEICSKCKAIIEAKE
jgi:hypothetical protein